MSDKMGFIQLSGSLSVLIKRSFCENMNRFLQVSAVILMNGSVFQNFSDQFRVRITLLPAAGDRRSRCLFVP